MLKRRCCYTGRKSQCLKLGAFFLNIYDIPPTDRRLRIADSVAYLVQFQSGGHSLNDSQVA
jgi:hypothetical protein